MSDREQAVRALAEALPGTDDALTSQGGATFPATVFLGTKDEMARHAITEINAYPEAKAALAAYLTTAGSALCGCTIHDDRGEQCPNPGPLCRECQLVCWGWEPHRIRTSGITTLDEAWAAAEAVRPKGWAITLSRHDGTWRAEAESRRVYFPDRLIVMEGRDQDPAAALRALAERLSER